MNHSASGPESRPLQLAEQRRRPGLVVVCIGGHVVDQFRAQQLEREAGDVLAEVAAKGSRRDRGQHALAHQRGEHPGVLAEGRAALRVGEQHAVALADERHHQLLDVVLDRSRRRLDEQPRPTAEAQPAQLLATELRGSQERDLRSGPHLELEALLLDPAVQILDQRQDRRGTIAVAAVDVRCGHQGPDARPDRDLHHRQRLLDRLRPVVDPGQHVAVQIDHRR